MRIASLSPAATEILFALGAGDQIVCTDQFSNWPDEAKALPHVRDHQAVKPADLAPFAPEVTLTGTVVQRALAEELRGKGFGVVHQDPRSLRDIEECIRQLGALVDAEKEAETLALSLRQGFNGVKKVSGLFRKHRKVYVEEWHLPPMASGNWVPELVRLAGAEPFPIGPGELSREVTLDEVMRFDPDLIVISWCGAGALADKTLLERRPGWEELRAVQAGNVRVIDDSLLNRPGPRLVDGARHLYGWLFELQHGS